MIRVLLLADTHLGFDLPGRPRGDRPHRGGDFFSSFDRALAPARRGEVDLVVHAGDLLYRSRVSPVLVSRALEPLLAVADAGTPVVLVPGNHERSSLPYPLLAAHERLHVLDRPRTVRVLVHGVTVALTGFPCERDAIASRFGGLLAAAGGEPADVRLLCMHQTVEGARVGPSGFTFRAAPDVIGGRLLPRGFAAVLAGHIHRHQVLTHDLGGAPLAAPVLYPGSTERTSFAERDETKGAVVLELEPEPARGGRLRRWTFRELPTRPMRVVTVAVHGLGAEALRWRLHDALATQPADAVVQLRLDGELAPAAAEVLRVAALRRLHPAEMIVSVRVGRLERRSTP